ncbi:hypothetical protein V0U79_09220 [Hyphobacterium sp. HN65]|uniref:Translation initiation factor IF-3 n=1 Tax=Hyphobacterium lacteum TaxID=3116575 RepID=A0ABU7LSC7_9PROT|nr:hypothetical protein [Hyphobacterium sp. HN65]MEE2526546.1 hypothetical protein [Hyphobacterium sp. HN65]
MSAIWRMILRPSLAYIAAAIVAGLSIALVFYGLSLAEGGDELTLEGVISFLAVSILVGAYVAAFAAIPAFVLIMLFRLVRLPRGWLDAIAGAVIGAGMIHLMAYGASGAAEAPNLINLLFAVAGAAGGFTYWLLAGRPKPPYSRQAV